MAARYEILLGTFVLFAESRSMQVGVFPVERDHAYYQHEFAYSEFDPVDGPLSGTSSELDPVDGPLSGDDY